jgi:ComF family protein
LSLGFDSALRLNTYEGPLKDAILRCKSAHHEGLMEELGRHWARHQRDRFERLGVAAIVPVPLHWRRRLARGYNQSVALAWGLSKELGLPRRLWWLWRIRATQSQRTLGPTERHANVRGAFRARRASSASLRGQHVLLVDDVMTTGATASEAALALKSSGSAGRVTVAVLAHATG